MRRNRYGFYEIDGHELISITHLLSIVFGGLPSYIIDKMVKKHGTWEQTQVYKREMGEYGTHIHRVLNDYFFHPEITENLDEVSNRLKQIEEQFKHYQITLLEGEQEVYHIGLGCAGTMDVWANSWNDFKLVGDYKTGYPTFGKDLMQIAIYGFMKDPALFTDGKVAGFIAYLGRDDNKNIDFRYVPPVLMKRGFTQFQNILAYYNYTKEVNKKTKKKK